MQYAVCYYAKHFGPIVKGPLAGRTADGEQVELLDAETEDAAMQWATDRLKEYLPLGRVEVWAKQWVGGRKGKFNHWKIGEVKGELAS